MDETNQSLVELLDAHGGRLHRLLAKLTADRDAADDLLQELFLRQLKSTAVLEAPSPEAYLFRSAINLAFDWRKRTKRSHEHSLVDSDLVTSDRSPSDQLVMQEKTQQVLAAMDLLSTQDRELISLRFLQGESYEWIADNWDSTPHRIRSRCSKALARLRKLVTDDRPISESSCQSTPQSSGGQP